MGEPQNAVTDPDSGLRQYRWKGEALTSVTSMRRVVGTPFHLAAWQVNQAIDAVLDNPGLVNEALAAVARQKRAESDDAFATRLRKAQRRVIRQAAEVKRNVAADLGTAVHEAAESGIQSVALDPNDSRRPFLQQWERWVDIMRPDILLQECQVFNLTEKYAGSVDLVCDMDGESYVVDIKTGEGLYIDHAIQLCLYSLAEFVGGYDPVLDDDIEDAQATSVFRRAKKAAILHLRPTHFEWQEVPISDDTVEAALSMVRFARWLMDNPTMEDLIRKGM
jgi:hypothetical protein